MAISQNFQASPVNFIHKQIEKYFEDLIVSGKLKPGDRLEPTPEIARKLHVGPHTVQKSLASLTSRGFLVRSQKRGTLVNPSACCHTIGIIFGLDDFADPDNTFWFSLLKEIENAAEKSGWNCKVYLVGSNEKKFGDVIWEVEADIADGKIRAAIALSPGEHLYKWLEQGCAVPSSIVEDIVLYDYQGFIEEGIRYLLENGCRDVGVLYSGDKTMIAKILEHLKESKRMKGWNYNIAGSAVGRSAGYETAREIFKSHRTRFDALFIFDDRACEGVVVALLELGLRIPQDVALLSWANKGVEIFSPVPVTRLEFDTAEHAKALLDDLESQIEGRSRRKITMRATLIPGRSCGMV